MADGQVTAAALLGRHDDHRRHAGCDRESARRCVDARHDGDGEIQDGAWVADITGLLDLSSWPAGMRVIVRKERPHPGCPALSLAWAETDSLSADRCRCPGSLVSAVGVVYPTGQTSVHRQAMVDSSVLTL